MDATLTQVIQYLERKGYKFTIETNTEVITNNRMAGPPTVESGVESITEPLLKGDYIPPSFPKIIGRKVISLGSQGFGKGRYVSGKRTPND